MANKYYQKSGEYYLKCKECCEYKKIHKGLIHNYYKIDLLEYNKQQI